MIILEKIIGLGAFVMMPIVMFIMGLIFRVKPKDALRAGITVGIGFKGIQLSTSLITETMTPLVQQLQKLWGIGLDAVDLGVPVISSMAFGDGEFVLLMFASIFIVNVIMLVLNITKTLNVDIWNFWHYLFIGLLASIVTNNMWIGLLVGTLYSAINLVLADRNQEIICEVHGEQFRGLSFCTMAFPLLVPLNQLIDYIIDHIPGIRKIDFNLRSVPEKYAFFTEPIMIGVICGIGLGALARFPWDRCLESGMTLAAAMFLLPRMISILMEGLSPIAQGARDFMSKKFENREFRIGMDFSLLIGDPDMITLGVIFVPIALLMAVFLPGNRVLPVIGLTNLTHIMMAPITSSKRNMFRAAIMAFINIALIFFMATSMTPLITKLAVANGIGEPGGFYSIFNTGEHVGFILLKIVEFFQGIF